MIDIALPFRYSRGYLGMLLPAEMFAALPSSLSVGAEVLQKKDEFHVTLANIEHLSASVPGVIDAENRLLDVFTAHKHSLSWGGFVNEFRNATEGERSTLVVRCKLAGIEDLFAAFDTEFGVSFNRQPAHVTLYTLQPNRGIGIHTEAQMRSYPTVEFPELFATLSA